MGSEMCIRDRSVIRDSILFANADPESALPTMRKYAAEFDDEVLMQHVKLYVNQWTVDLGEVGRGALAVLSREARKANLAGESNSELEVFNE